jgi:tetratricopeptide (TPR) repeat protein
MGVRMQALVAQQADDFDAAEQLLQDALTTFRHLNWDVYIAVLLGDLGKLEYEHKHDEAARQYLLEALLIGEKSGDKEGQTIYLNCLGFIVLNNERWAEARELFEKALQLAREVGRQDSIAASGYGLALAYEAEGQPNRALSLAQEALSIYERLRTLKLAEVKELVERTRKKVDLQSPPARESQ